MVAENKDSIQFLANVHTKTLQSAMASIVTLRSYKQEQLFFGANHF